MLDRLKCYALARMSNFAKKLDEVLKRKGVLPAAAVADKVRTIHKGRNGTADPSYISHLRKGDTPARWEVVDQIAKAIGQPHADELFLAFTEDVCPWAAEQIETLAAERMRAELRLTGGDIADSIPRPTSLFDRAWARTESEEHRRALRVLLRLAASNPDQLRKLIQAAEAFGIGGGTGEHDPE
jgi:hypothetical protein